MRTFQRVFLRAGVRLRHTEGFNPHPYMNFALPLSVGVESVCELLDFDLLDDTELGVLPALLNKTMPEGIEAVKAYQPTRKFAEIAWLRVEGRLVYDRGVQEHAVDKLMSLFKSKELIIAKKSKKGCTDTDISPLIHHVGFELKNGEELTMDAIIAAQNPSLNPEYLIAAVKKYLPSYTPDFVEFKRVEVFDSSQGTFR